MGKKLLVGTDIFNKLIKSNGYYVDKTEILYELVEETPNEVTLFTRPRRFGKTLTMSMLESFFDIRQNSRDVFEGLSIMDHTEFCEKYMNRYSILFISLKDVEGLTFEKAYGRLRTVIANLCKKHAYLEFGEKVLPADAELFHKLQYGTADASNVENALITIMRMMNAVYEVPVILLIDEYDVPLAKAYSNGYYQKMLDVIRSIMSISLKTNEYLKFAVVAGCLRIPKESIFTGVNNFASYSVLEEEFSQYFGFTQREIEKLLEAFGQSDHTDAIRQWYDGYVFGNIEIYCPWDAVSYVRDLLKRRDAKPKPYWENTSGNDAIKAFFEMEDVDISDKFERLLNGETITESVINALTYEEAFASESNLWSVLLMTGYVTCVRNGEFAEDDAEGIREVELRIPNREIAVIFQRSVVDHFNRRVDRSQIRELMQAMWNGDEKLASRVLSDLLWHTISYMDYHEDYYHAFVTGIFVGRGGYAVRSNKERGLGRPDVDLRDKKNRRAMIIEAKKSENKNRMEYWCDKAIRQIVDNEYAREMDGYTEILCYGIAFFEKSAQVKLMK